MAIKNFFKKKKKEEEKIENKKEEKIPLKKEKEEKEEKGKEIYPVLKSVHITEKSGDLEKRGQYIFRVFPKANKTEIKKAVERIYGANVESVKIINTSDKKRRLGKIKGIRSGYKKAIIKIKKGEKIEQLSR